MMVNGYLQHNVIKTKTVVMTHYAFMVFAQIIFKLLTNLERKR